MVMPIRFDLWQHLLDAGLVAAEPAPLELGLGNQDRRRDSPHQVYLATLPGGSRAKLTLGPGLAARHDRIAACAADCPELVAAPLFHRALAGTEVLAEAFYEGVPFERAAREALVAPETLAAAVASARAALAATERGSDEAARQAEWADWTGGLLALPVWQARDRELLADRIFPRLYPLLAVAPPVTRWTNGDFTGDNLIVNRRGVPRLVDFEHARRTHFFAEDAVRYRTLTVAARDQPHFLAPVPDPGLAWHLFFWLRQWGLEVEHNSPAYLARHRPARLGLIRRLAEHLLDCRLDGWPVDATPVAMNVEKLRGVETAALTVHVTGWCFVPSQPGLAGIVATQGDRQLAQARLSDRPDVQRHFAGNPAALASGFTLQFRPPAPGERLHLAALAPDGSLLPFFAFTPSDLPNPEPSLFHYAEWAAAHDPDPPSRPPAPEHALPFSILLPVYNPPVELLRACVDSVRRQYFPHWEVCLVDDGSSAPGVAAYLETLAGDPRIRCLRRAANGGIARATNDALAMARGEFVVLLDHDDLLRPHALAELAASIARDPEVDALYSDEEKITAEGERLAPFLKPAFSPEFLLGVMYVGHVLCVRTEEARAIGGFDPVFDGVQDYEFVLRLSRRTRRIRHLPVVLYYWRQAPGSSALHGNAKGNMDERQAAAVEAHLRQTADPRRAVRAGGHRVRLEAPEAPRCRVVRGEAGVDPVRALAAAAAATTEPVLLWVGPGVAAEDAAAWSGALAALAARPDSGLVAPVLRSREGKVLESGWTVGPAGAGPLMAGFDPAGDGFNGALSCNREVAAVSPLCVAVRPDLVAEAATAGDWLAFCAALAARGFHHRVCAAVHVPTTLSHREDRAIRGAAAPRPDPYYNPRFDPIGRDYTLVDAPGTSAPRQTIWYLDTRLPDRLADGNLALAGWALRRDGQAVALRITVGGITWSTLCQEPRPDVAVTHPGLTNGACGFTTRLRVPTGAHQLRLEAVAADGHAELLLERALRVPPWASLRRCLFNPPQKLLAFQMLAGPSQPAGPVRPERFPRASGRPGPRFAIVTPSYQQARFLRETMQSVLGQAGVAGDYVVQDGGSTDGSVEVIQSLANAPAAGGLRLTAWDSARDHGQADAIVRGFARTQGGPDDVMAWLNSDDYYLPGTLAFVADYFARHPEVDVVYGHRILIDERSREVGRWFLPAHDDAVLRLGDFVPQETLFWRRRIWDRAGGLDASFQFAMDWDLLLRFQAAGARMVRLPYFLACFRIHANQKTSAVLHDTGRLEIERLRTRTHGTYVSPAQLEMNPRLVRYLRRSARIELAWRGGLRLD